MQDWERETFLLHARQEGYRRRKEEAKNIVKQAMAEYPGIWAVAYSGGKDSTVLLHILLEAGWKGPMVLYYYSEIENPPENIEMAKRESKEHGLELHILDCKESSSLEAFREAGHLFIYPATKEEKRIVNIVDTAFRKKVDNFAHEMGFAGMFLGLRRDESNRRAMSLAKTGPIYQTKSRNIATSCPLHNWNGDDIWAYIVENHLPYLACYDTPGYDRRRLRNEINLLCGKKSMSLGLMEQYKRTYPDLYKKLAIEFPEIDTWIGREIK